MRFYHLFFYTHILLNPSRICQEIIFSLAIYCLALFSMAYYYIEYYLCFVIFEQK